MRCQEYINKLTMQIGLNWKNVLSKVSIKWSIVEGFCCTWWWTGLDHKPRPFEGLEVVESAGSSNMHQMGHVIFRVSLVSTVHKKWIMSCQPCREWISHCWSWVKWLACFLIRWTLILSGWDHLVQQKGHLCCWMCLSLICHFRSWGCWYMLVQSVQ